MILKKKKNNIFLKKKIKNYIIRSKYRTFYKNFIKNFYLLNGVKLYYYYNLAIKNIDISSKTILKKNKSSRLKKKLSLKFKNFLFI